MNEILIHCQDVSLFLPGEVEMAPVLTDISWDIRRGEHWSLSGTNGSGKSTLLRLLAGELWPSKGVISWRDETGKLDTSPLTGRALCSLVSPALQFGYQRHGFSITGLELVLTGLDGSPLLYSECERSEEERARVLARRLSCEDLLYRDISGLSMGQLRILLMARALIREPKLLLLDECTDGLDTAHVMRVLEVLEQVAEFATLIFVSHNASLIPSFITRHKYMKDGRLSSHPETSEQSVVQDGLHIGAKAPAEKERREANATRLLYLEKATVFVAGVEVLHAINWSVYTGEHWQIRGENGSGKSTLLRLIAGDEFCAAGGKIERFLPKLNRGRGGIVTGLDEMRRGISLVSADSEVAYDYPVTALELVSSGFENSVGIYRSYSEEELAWAKTCARAFFRELSEAEFKTLLKTPHSRLSTGQLRRFFLARALVNRPDILLLDEPINGLDQSARSQYLSLLNELGEGTLILPKVTIIFVSHTDACPSCLNRYARMHEGRLFVD